MRNFTYKRRVSITLMALTITGIVAFQASWLYKNYREEKKLFQVHTSLLFRETILGLEATRLHLDSSFHFGAQESSEMAKMTQLIRNYPVKDSSGKMHFQKNIIISMNHEELSGNPDSPHQNIYKAPDVRVFNLNVGADSLLKPFTIAEISRPFHLALDKEGIHIPFHIKEAPGDRTGRDSLVSDQPPADLDEIKIIPGLGKNMAYELEFDGLSWYLAKKVSAQAIFSLVLVGITVVSFFLLYRNWQQQRRLTLLKNDFISNITHELKTPIATLSVAVEALKNFSALQDPARTHEYLDISSIELQRLSLLVDKVLKLSLFEKEEIELKNDYFDLRVLVEEVAASMRLQFEKYKAKLELIVQDVDFHIRADKLHITSVVFNLLDNALKYSRQDPFITIRLEAGGERLVLSVTDNGVGIPALYKDRIFEKFFRVPTGDRHNVKGYGLGLSYVSYVLQRQGGEISVESQEGAGSRFIVKIPRENG